MCNNVKSSVRLQLCFHLADTYFQLLSIFVSPSLSLSAFHHFIVHLHSFIVPLCTSHLFQCFITARLTSSSTPFFPHTHTHKRKLVCFQCTCFFSRARLVRVFPPCPHFLHSLNLFSSYCSPADCSSVLPGLCLLDQDVCGSASVSYTGSVIE